MRIKLKKIAESADPFVRSAKWEDYKMGQDNGDISLPVEYELTGVAINKPEIGKSFVVNRETRNGVECSGMFMCSRIKNIREENGIKFLETENSVYSIEEL